MHWDTVIGLEVHAQLSTQSKLFSGSSTQSDAAPNTQVSFIDAGLPGVLPTLNQEAVRMAIRFGLAIHASIHRNSIFERKNYFYPDLPKGYQISQLQHPVIQNGYLMIHLSEGTEKKIMIERAHLEEDAGKSVHDIFPQHTGIDLNRAGVPLLEIVTTPCLSSSTEAVLYLKTLRQLLRYLGICDGNLESGSFRCDVNLSLRPTGTQTLGTRTELKNMNSFRFIEKAIQYEQERHLALLESGKPVEQETRYYCPNTQRTLLLRRKETENDYRYFPDPDLLPLEITEADIQAVQDHLPPLPETVAVALREDDHLTAQHIEFLLTSIATLDYYYAVKQDTQASPQLIMSWLTGPLTKALADTEHWSTHIPPKHLAELLNHLVDKTLTSHQANQVLAEMLTSQQPPSAILSAGFIQPAADEGALQASIEDILKAYPEQIAAYQAGKTKLLGFFIGQVMKTMPKKTDPTHISQLVQRLLRLE